MDFGLQGGFAHVIENEQKFPHYFGKVSVVTLGSTGSRRKYPMKCYTTCVTVGHSFRWFDEGALMAYVRNAVVHLA